MASLRSLDGKELDSSIRIREATVEDIHKLAGICFLAFKEFNESVGIDYENDFNSIDMTVTIIRSYLDGPEKALYGAVAESIETGQLMGSGFLHHSDSEAYAVGPISVDPEVSQRGVGRAIMTSLVDRAMQEGATSIRLTQASPNTASFALYLSLGFLPKDCYAIFRGTIEPERVEAAAFAVGLTPNPEAMVRIMEEADVPACAQFFKDTNGYDRLQGIQTSLGPHAWVITSKAGEILGYTTGFEKLSHLCVRNESDFITLCHGITKSVKGDFFMTVSTSRYPKLAQWALAARLRLIRHNWYMVIGDYQAPKDNRVYFPNVLH